MQACKDCGKVAEKYIEISHKNSKELQEACTGGGVACITWQELIQGATNVANDADPSQIRLDEKLKDPTAASPGELSEWEGPSISARQLGFDRRIPVQKTSFNSDGQPVFYDGKNYITSDIDSRNVTNGWKIFGRKGNRAGTYDIVLKGFRTEICLVFSLQKNQ